MATEINVSQLHPSVSSVISSTPSTYVSNTSQTTLFCADVFECGVDNAIKKVSSVNEFHELYGNPNMVKYGQGAYNVVKWLESGGDAFILRVLPDDAKYAHAILNIKTKVDQKDVLDYTNNLVSHPNVSIKPVISYIDVNANAEAVLTNELKVDRSRKSDGQTPQKSLDGYSDNFILVAYPNGRGEYYNKLGFAISPNKSFDEMYDFKIYDFTIVTFDESSNYSIVEGPFNVSFNPDATSSSNESLFIEDVVNKYSSMVKVKFSTENFIKVAGIINPDVNPYKIDILKGQTRMINDEPETYYSNVTGKSEDIHMSLHSYNETGVAITIDGEYIKNIDTDSSTAEQAILALDNATRRQEYDDTNSCIVTMKKAYSSLLSNNYSSDMSNIVDKVDLGINGNDDDIKSIEDKAVEYSTDFNSYNETLSKYITLEETNKDLPKEERTELTDDEKQLISENNINIINAIELNEIYEDCINVVSDTKDVIAYYKILDDNTKESTITSILTSTEKMIEGLFITQKNNLRLSVVNEEISNISIEVDSYDNSLSLDDKKEGVDIIKNRISALLTQITNIASETVKNSTNYTKIYTMITNDLKTVNDDFKTVDYISDVLVETTLSNIFDTFARLYSNLDILASYVVCSANYEIITSIVDEYFKEDAENALIALVEELKESAVEIISDRDRLEVIKTSATEVIENEKTLLVQRTSSAYSNNLQNFDAPIKFNGGSDGCFAISNSNRKENIKKTLIKAYKGTLCEDVINKKLIEFNHIIDANYDPAVKLAIITLARDIRKDFFYWVDTNLQASPEDVLNWRKNEFNINTYFAGIFSQDFTFYDEFTGKDVKMTTPYVLASKIPACASSYGLQFPIAGNTRGLVDGYKKLSWSPSETYKEALYLKKVNYIEEDPRRTRIGSQLTAEAQTSPLSNINNVLTLLDIKRNVEIIVEDYQFEFNDSETQTALQSELNTYLSKYVSNRSCENITVSVTASDYDKVQKLIRVGITIKFNGIIERVVVSLDVIN